MLSDVQLWPASIRYAVLVNICLFTFMGNMFQAGLATGFPALAAEFHVVSVPSLFFNSDVSPRSSSSLLFQHTPAIKTNFIHAAGLCSAG